MSSSSLNPDTVEGHIALQAKQLGITPEEFISRAEISRPSNVRQELTVTFDPNTLKFTGIPEGWAEEAYRQFGVPLTTCPRLPVDGYPDRIPAVLVILKKRFVELGG